MEVDLDLLPSVPPAVLFHGTASRNVDAIRAEGLKPGTRQQVHLSLDTETARRVGMRHGTPVIFRVDAARMHADGISFWQADNGVWLTDEVPPSYLVPVG